MTITLMEGLYSEVFKLNVFHQIYTFFTEKTNLIIKFGRNC